MARASATNCVFSALVTRGTTAESILTTSSSERAESNRLTLAPRKAHLLVRELFRCPRPGIGQERRFKVSGGHPVSFFRRVEEQGARCKYAVVAVRDRTAQTDIRFADAVVTVFRIRTFWAE